MFMPLEVTLRFLKIFLHHVPQLFHPGLSLIFSSLKGMFPLTFGVFSFLVWSLFHILMESLQGFHGARYFQCILCCVSRRSCGRHCQMRYLRCRPRICKRRYLVAFRCPVSPSASRIFPHYLFILCFPAGWTGHDCC